MWMSEAELHKILANNPSLKVQGLEPGTKTNTRTAALPRPIFESAAEERYFNKCVYPSIVSGFLLKYELHKTFEIIPALEHCGKKYKNRVYTPDFYLEYRDGSTEVVEIKGRVVKKLQRDYPLRRQLFILNFCIPNNWRFLEVHDDEI